uniref:Adenosine receptor A3 n=1 Tax=Chinchilla lanigera TaxID=34839 RepID=A0A8C2VDQ2_CHILA
MRLFILLSLTLFSDAMVMDKKVKESFVLDTASATCNYDAHYKYHTKYWCRGYFRNYCNVIAFTPNSTDRVVLKDTGNQLIVTVSCLTKEDSGWYWCGIQRNFARDDMDFTELIVTDHREAPVLPEKDSSVNKNISCRASEVFPKVDLARVFILIICLMMTGFGIVFIIIHLSRRTRRSNRRAIGKGLVRRPRTIQSFPVTPTPL